MKIVLASDFHLSYRQYNLKERERDFYNKFEKLIDEIIKEKPNLFIQLGDIFDEPKPKPLAIKIFNDGIQKLKDNNIEVLGIVGNHTTLQIKDFYPIDFLFEDIKYLDGDYVVYDDVFIGGVKYHSKIQKQDIKNKIDYLAEQSKNYKTKILLLHQGLKNDIEIGYDFTEEELKLDRFDYIFLGHLHKRILRKNDTSVYHYPGSLNSCSVVEMLDEMNQGKGYSVFDTDTGEIEIKNLTSDREFVDIEITEDELNNSFINKTIESLKEHSIKPIVRLKCVANNQTNVYEFIKKLEDVTLFVVKKIIYSSDELEQMERLNWENISIQKMIESKFDEKWQSDLAVELFNQLKDNKIESAQQISEEIYRKYYTGDVKDDV